MAEFFANNKSDMMGMYFYRKLYKDTALPKKEALDLFVADHWYNIPHYGCVNTNYDAVFPSEAYLKQVRPATDTIMAINFVTDAFKDFASRIKQSIFVKKVDREESFLEGWAARRAWASPHALYHDHMETVYDAFFYSIPNSEDQKITNFSSFIKVFRRVIVTLLNEGYWIPLTRSEYILSRHATPRVSGLGIETAELDHSIDVIKEKYLTDRNFEYYKNTAVQFGFMVDKNAPWRLIANLTSPMMEKYMSVYGITADTLLGLPEEVFSTSYYKAYESDIDSLKEYMRIFYNTYVTTRPETKVNGNVVVRSPALWDWNELRGARYNQKYWLEYYLYIRSKEAKIDWEDYVFKKKHRKIVHIQKRLDYSSALSYINDEIKKERGTPRARSTNIEEVRVKKKPVAERKPKSFRKIIKYK